MTAWMLILALSLIGSAFFSGMETGIVSINKLRLHHMLRRRVRHADTLDHLVQTPEFMLSTTLVGANMCNSLFSVGVAVLLAGLGPLADVVSLVVTTMVILVFGEYLPKAWFQSDPAWRTRRFAPLLTFFGRWCFYPVGWSVSRLVRILLPDPAAGTMDDDGLTRDELKDLLGDKDAVGLEGALVGQKRALLQGIFELDTMTCADLMIPRAEMTVVEKGMGVVELLELIRTGHHRHRRIPVYDPEQGQFTGIINVFDIIRTSGHEQMSLEDFSRPPQFTTEDTPADELIPRFRRSRQPILLVRNTEDEVVGCVTTQIVLEQMVGGL